MNQNQETLMSSPAAALPLWKEGIFLGKGKATELYNIL